MTSTNLHDRYACLLWQAQSTSPFCLHLSPDLGLLGTRSLMIMHNTKQLMICTHVADQLTWQALTKPSNGQTFWRKFLKPGCAWTVVIHSLYMCIHVYMYVMISKHFNLMSLSSMVEPLMWDYPSSSDICSEILSLYNLVHIKWTLEQEKPARPQTLPRPLLPQSFMHTPPFPSHTHTNTLIKWTAEVMNE